MALANKFAKSGHYWHWERQSGYSTHFNACDYSATPGLDAL